MVTAVKITSTIIKFILAGIIAFVIMNLVSGDDSPSKSFDAIAKILVKLFVKLKLKFDENYKFIERIIIMICIVLIAINAMLIYGIFTAEGRTKKSKKVENAPVV